MRDRLQATLKEAMKARDQVRMETIRSLISAIQYEEMQKGVETLPEKDSIPLLKRELGRRKEELEYAEKAKREEQIAKLNREMEIISSYLPTQMSEDELEKIIMGYRSADPGLNLSNAMKLLKEQHAGTFDGKVASDIARRVFGA